MVEKFDKMLNKIDTFLLCEVDLYRTELEKLINEFDEDAWLKLSGIWELRDEKWQLNCIYSIEGVESERADQLIGEMLLSKYREVILAVLNSLYDAGCGKWTPEIQQISLLETMLSTWNCSEEINGLLGRA